MGDRFLRWERRWYIDTEIMFTREFILLAQRNWSLELRGLQMQALLDCDKEGPQQQQWVVECTIEDIALQGLVSYRDELNERRAQVLQETDAAMTGAVIQLHADGDGRVPHVDLEGLWTGVRRDRVRVEAMRTLALRLLLPFQLELPEVIRDGAQWYEPSPRIMTMIRNTVAIVPGGPVSVSRGSGGGTRVAHYLNDYGGHLLVQSVGRAMISEIDVEAFYDLRLNGVAIFDPSTGIMRERVWSVSGLPTASSSLTQFPQTYRHVGELRMLGDHERVQIGETRLVHPSAWKTWTSTQVAP